MARTGPTPKRSEERTRRNAPEGVPISSGLMMPVRKPAVPTRWHRRAKSWYKSLDESGHSYYFQNSDWEYALMVGEQLNMLYRQYDQLHDYEVMDEKEYIEKHKHRGSSDGKKATRPYPPSAKQLEVVNRMLAALGTTESDRRDMHIELKPQVKTDAQRRAEKRDRALEMIQNSAKEESVADVSVG